MSSSERTTAARMAADPIALEAVRSVAALFDQLERAGGGAAHTRSPNRRPASYRPAGARKGGVRTVPLRSVQPAPMARRIPGTAPAIPAAQQPAPAPGRVRIVIRWAALWGAGPQGEYLAWTSSRPARPAAAPRSAAPTAGRRPGPLRHLVRRIALWGAGPDGEYLAWGAPARPVAKREADRPVVLREMPSTPTIQTPLIQPAAPSPAAVLSPHDPASTGSRGMPPVPRGAVAVPGVRPRGRPERSHATGWPPRTPASGVATGLIRARGDPWSCPTRGSPVSARRTRSPGSLRSSFP